MLAVAAYRRVGSRRRVLIGLDEPGREIPVMDTVARVAPRVLIGLDEPGREIPVMDTVTRVAPRMLLLGWAANLRWVLLTRY